MKASASDRIEVRNVNVSRYRGSVRRDKYQATAKALLKALSRRARGLTQAEMRAAVVPLLPSALFPKGKTAMWWIKTVQLDLEARGELVRIAGKPLRWRRA
jgi:hypothetical protein